MQNIIITGFEPFNAKYNPTKDVLDYFKYRRCDGNLVRTDILPVTFQGASERLVAGIEELNPYLVLSLSLSASGLNTRRKDLNFEKRGLNIMNAKNPDANGFRPENQPIDENGPEYREVIVTGFNAEDIVEYLKENEVRARTSDDPGKYVCNDLIYRTLAAIEQKRLRTKFGFIHMPWLEHYRGQDIDVDWDKKATMHLDEVVKGIELVIERV